MIPFRHDWWFGVRQSGEINRKAGLSNLIDVKLTLDKFKIPFVLSGGVLLGIIRDNDFIKWDHDIDLFCFNEPARHDSCKMRWVKNELENKGFYIVDSSRCRCKCEYFIKDGERVDIFWLDKIDDEWIFNNEIRYPAYFFDKEEYVVFEKHKFRVPSSPEKFLEYSYGPDWKTPIQGASILNLNPKIRKWDNGRA